MNSIDSLYRTEDGYLLIEMKLSSVIQLFNTFDPAPFHEKELDINAENYIVDTVKDFPPKTRFKIVIYLPDVAKDTQEAAGIPGAIRSHFEYKSLTQRRKFRERLVYGEFTLIVGLPFLAIATLAGLAIDAYSTSFPVAHLVANILTVTGWAAMWEPVTVLLFQLWPILRQRKVYEMISRMEIVIRPYPKASPQAPDLFIEIPRAIK